MDTGATDRSARLATWKEDLQATAAELIWRDALASGAIPNATTKGKSDDTNFMKSYVTVSTTCARLMELVIERHVHSFTRA